MSECKECKCLDKCKLSNPPIECTEYKNYLIEEIQYLSEREGYKFDYNGKHYVIFEESIREYSNDKIGYSLNPSVMWSIEELENLKFEMNRY